MNSRERVITTLYHKEPDRVPLDCGATRSTGISAVAYNNLKRHLGVQEGDIRVYDMAQQLAMPEQWFLDMFEVDVIDLAWPYCQDSAEWVDWQLADGSPAKRPARLPIRKEDSTWVFRHSDGQVLGLMPPGSQYFDQTYWPLADGDPQKLERAEEYFDRALWMAMKAPFWDRAGDPDFYQELKRRAKELYETTDYAIVASYGGQLIGLGRHVYGIDNFLADLATERKRIESFLDRLVEIHIQGLEPFLKAVSPYVQVIWMGDDLGMQMGPFMSPQMFQEVLKPRYKSIYDEVKRKSGLPIMLHSCGSIYSLLPDLIEMGVDIINPVQVSAAEMDPVRLKDDFGQDIVFWGGGVDTQNVLSRKGPDEVRRDTEEKMRVFSPGGGFVFNPVHNIQADVPPENILAMYDAFRAERGYPVA